MFIIQTRTAKGWRVSKAAKWHPTLESAVKHAQRLDAGSYRIVDDRGELIEA